MSRVIWVTGGFSGAATADVTDSLKQLGGCSFAMALTPVGQDDPPAIGSLAWVSVTPESASSSNAVVSLRVDSTQPVGFYNLVLDVIKDGQHQAEWVMDRRRPSRRALVVVT